MEINTIGHLVKANPIQSQFKPKQSQSQKPSQIAIRECTKPLGVMSTLAAPTNNWLATDSVANESTLVRRHAVSKIHLRMAGVSKIVCE